MLYCAQLGAEYSAALTVAGALQMVPLKIDHSRLPLLATAAHITLPAPSLVQLGSELTVPARLVQLVPHAVPLNSFTIMAALPLRTAQTTRSVETWAQDGTPTPVPVPVEMKLPQLAHADGLRDRQRGKSSRHNTIRFIPASSQIGFSEPT
ncbi:hypothetical protein SBA7_1220002 [Candidatus Sulfotelmatobacter sp. SbA7]|nr:hypothetical protein SBA7_1220002 [Candidatus Sulfotelmatobacter sp. SbA7]